MRLLARIFGNALALLATQVVPGIVFHGDALQLLFAGALLGLFNLVVRPLAMLLSLPALILSLGLFYFVLNGLLLWAFSWFVPAYSVDGVIAGMLGSLVIALVNWALSAVFGGDEKKKQEE
ncbi:MAG: phage holin family protein [Vicinamibacteria bacterium]|jgi:putative membrane protein|nr:phage holin family protein [Vicinamibacteria bacterium]